VARGEVLDVERGHAALLKPDAHCLQRQLARTRIRILSCNRTLEGGDNKELPGAAAALEVLHGRSALHPLL
jgi:hypothetical protein